MYAGTGILNSISVLCRINPNTARIVVNNLANFYRKNLNKSTKLVDIYSEIAHVLIYVNKRLEYTFGEVYDPQIDSRPGEGRN
ncbi:MAG: histidine kinase [Thermoanaerobacteraceae bacterium]|nr:histidine kinase [Thermoanaerobacteraceae bacterium]